METIHEDGQSRASAFGQPPSSTSSAWSVKTARIKYTILKATSAVKVKITANLSPVRKHLTIAAIRDKLVWKLGHFWVKVVHDHVHNGCRISTLGRIFLQWVCPGKTYIGKKFFENITHTRVYCTFNGAF